jgi:endonuclease/exonuclease/phosphatase family metal-dependent hydrolase
MPTRVVLGLIAVLCVGACEQAEAPQSTARPPAPAPTAQPAADTANRTGEADDAAAEDATMFVRYGLKAPLPRTEGAIRLATYNVENLFDDDDDPTLVGDIDDAMMTKPRANRQAAADALRRIDADVVALQEVESEAALRWFLAEHASDLGYTHVMSLDAGDGRGIEQSVISRFPLSNPRQWIGEDLGGIHPEMYGNQPNWNAGKPLTIRRSPLAVDVTLPGGQVITLFVVHHKSGQHAAYWREAEAKRFVALVAEMEAAHPERPIFVMGDFNATPDQASVQIYLNSGKEDALVATPSFVCAFVGRSGPEIVTHSSGRRIDLILANKAASRWLVPGSAFVLGTTCAPDGVGWDEARFLPGYASDHYPVVVDLKR